MSEARYRADHGGYLADWDHDGIAVLRHLDVVGGHHVDRSDDGPSIDDDHAHLLVVAEISASRARNVSMSPLCSIPPDGLLHRPNRRIEHDFDQVLPRSTLAKSAPA